MNALIFFFVDNKVYTTVTFSSMILGRVYAQLPDQKRSLEAAKTAFRIIERRSKIDGMSESGLKPTCLGTNGNKAFGTIHFDNVSFAYPNRQSMKVFRGLNLTIKQGQINALVGTSGK